MATTLSVRPHEYPTGTGRQASASDFAALKMPSLPGSRVNPASQPLQEITREFDLTEHRLTALARVFGPLAVSDRYDSHGSYAPPS